MLMLAVSIIVARAPLTESLLRHDEKNWRRNTNEQIHNKIAKKYKERVHRFAGKNLEHVKLCITETSASLYRCFSGGGGGA